MRSVRNSDLRRTPVNNQPPTNKQHKSIAVFCGTSLKGTTPSLFATVVRSWLQNAVFPGVNYNGLLLNGRYRGAYINSRREGQTFRRNVKDGPLWPRSYLDIIFSVPISMAIFFYTLDLKYRVVWFLIYFNSTVLCFEPSTHTQLRTQW